MKVNRVAERLSKIYHRVKVKNQQISFLSPVEDYRDCLVCMPSKMNTLLNAASRLPDIAAIFPNRIIKVLLTSSIDPQSYKFIKRFTIIKPYSYDLNIFYLPKKTFINKIISNGLSICIDMDIDSNFFNSTVSVLSGAPLRIGPSKGMGLPYYNLEIDLGDSKVPYKIKYENFIRVLYNFNNEGEKIAPIET